jgi:exopolyphosphatase/guanosine-5'-triphosphate,3'-diphosphate pyrophosphatase
MRRYHVDQAQAMRIAALARTLYGTLVETPDEKDTRMLEWAAHLHEIGLSIAHAAYHKHSAYVLANADMPGFSKDEQARLARIVLAHRGKLSKLADLSARSPDWMLIFALRIAVLFYRARVDVQLSQLHCRATAAGFRLDVPRAWLDAHPLTAAALDAEASQWQDLGLQLDVRENGDGASMSAA